MQNVEAHILLMMTNEITTLQTTMDRVRTNSPKKSPKLFQNFSKAEQPNSKAMKLVFICILIPNKNRKMLFSTNYFMTFWWMFNTTLSYIPYKIFLEFFQTKIQNLFTANFKILSFLQLSKSWKMSFSISKTFQKP